MVTICHAGIFPAKSTAAAVAGESATEAAAGAAETRKRKKAVKKEVWENWLLNSATSEQLWWQGRLALANLIHGIFDKDQNGSLSRGEVTHVTEGLVENLTQVSRTEGSADTVAALLACRLLLTLLLPFSLVVCC